ncbi:MAG: hypothetical protein ACK6CU_26135 [Deltaproteobacteria bacterium]
MRPRCARPVAPAVGVFASAPMASGDESAKTGETTSPEGVLASLESLAARPDLIEPARGIFRFTQYLLDEEENLTRTGNLTGSAKEQLRARTLELLGLDARAASDGGGERDTPGGMT